MSKVRFGTTFYFLEAPQPESEVLNWFRNLKEPPEIFRLEWGYQLYFRHLGPLRSKADGSPDPATSPVVTFLPPRLSHGVFWTMGEVQFRAKGGEMPGLDTVSRSFRSWISAFEIVFEQFPKPDRGFAYYLEGSIQSFAPTIRALPSAREALDQERYFISDFDSRRDLSAICRKLRLRGCHCD